MRERKCKQFSSVFFWGNKSDLQYMDIIHGKPGNPNTLKKDPWFIHIKLMMDELFSFNPTWLQYFLYKQKNYALIY